MTYVARRRIATRAIVLDRSLESLPIFRLSDSAEDSAISFSPESGGRWRVLPTPGDRLPGTFDQDVYIEILHRYHEAGAPDAGVISFTLHAFLRSIGRRVDGRTYEQLRSALTRLERTILASSGVYVAASEGQPLEGSFTLLSSVSIARRRLAESEPCTRSPARTASAPAAACVTNRPFIPPNSAAGHTVTLSAIH